jgi:glycosyltransferase involved in cell wall biosynthesis
MQVTHVGFRAANAPAPTIADTPAHRFIPVERHGGYRLQDLVRGAIGPLPFSVLNYTRSGMSEILQQLFRKQAFDIAILEGVQLGGYLSLLRSAECRPAVVCDWHNVESEILERYSANAGAQSAARKLYARMAAGKLERYERWFVNQCDMHVVVSERDRDALVHRYGSTRPVVLVDNGVPLDYFSAAEGPAPKRFRVLFSGAMDYHANVEAAAWFAAGAWPAIRSAAPDTVFSIVGRKPTQAVAALAAQPGIEVTGTVPDVRPYYREALVAVVPLRVGGGTRIKILEAMAAGVPVVSTGLGAEGLAAVPGEHYVLADSAGEISAAVTALLRDPEKSARLSDAGRELIRRRYDWASLGDQLAGHLSALKAKR